MPNKKHNDMGFHIDNAVPTLTDISLYINQQSLQRAIGMLEDTGMGQEEATFLPGLANTRIPINGYWNTTTDAIFGPAYLADNTSVTKTVAFKAYASRFYKGEALVSDLQLSGSKDSLETFSATLQITGAITRTSVVGS